MNALFKIPNDTLVAVRQDLRRTHAFAGERVGFLTAGATLSGHDQLLLLTRSYMPVDDHDYERDDGVGAKIGGNAMRKAVQAAYRERSALFHVHSHGGRGLPGFSGVDLDSGANFVPGFFHSVASMPHGMLVLSDDSATGLIWLGETDKGSYITLFVGVGATTRKFGART